MACEESDIALETPEVSSNLTKQPAGTTKM